MNPNPIPTPYPNPSPNPNPNPSPTPHQVFDDFNKLSESDQGTEGVQPGTAETLKGACLVVDALGPETRQEMVAWFCGWQFAPYKHAFQPFGEFGSLEKTELVSYP